MGTRVMHVLMRKTLGSLRPVDDRGSEMLHKIANGDMVKCEITRPRNLAHHRLFFALLNLVFSNQDRYEAFDMFRAAFTIALGHCDVMALPGGKVGYVPKSISFAKMDQGEFSAFYNQAVDLVCAKWLPGVSSDDVRREVLEMVARDE